MSKCIVCIVLLNALFLTASWAQYGTRTRMAILPQSKLVLNGNSTMHEYSSTASELTGKILVDSILLVEGTKSLKKPFYSVEIIIPVKKMRSGDEKLDNNLYEALKAEDHPDLIYRMTDDSVIAGGRDSLTLQTTGTLVVSGKEKVIEMTVTIYKIHDSTLSISGKKELFMTDFDVDPPSMMLGLLKTDNKVVIAFDVLIRRQLNVQR
jgi:hypothetical protein